MGSGTAADPLVLIASLDSINRALANGIEFLPPVGFLGSTMLTITSTDNGQTGDGSTGTDTDELQLTIIDPSTLNNPPVNHLPPPVATSVVPFLISKSTGSRIYVTDIDALPGSILTVSLELKDGRLKLPNASGLTISGDGSPALPLIFSGTLDDINAALSAGVLAIPNAGFLGETSLTIISNDNGNTGEGGVGIDTDVLRISIDDSNPVNNGPVNHLPPNIVTGIAPVILSAAARNEIYITDIDAINSRDFESTISVTNGYLSLLEAQGLSVTGNGTSGSPLKLVGPLIAINRALWTGLVYTPPQA